MYQHLLLLLLINQHTTIQRLSGDYLKRPKLYIVVKTNFTSSSHLTLQNKTSVAYYFEMIYNNYIHEGWVSAEPVAYYYLLLILHHIYLSTISSILTIVWLVYKIKFILHYLWRSSI